MVSAKASLDCAFGYLNCDIAHWQLRIRSACCFAQIIKVLCHQLDRELRSEIFRDHGSRQALYCWARDRCSTDHLHRPFLINILTGQKTEQFCNRRCFDRQKRIHRQFDGHCRSDVPGLQHLRSHNREHWH